MNKEQWLEKLISFDTISKNSNLELINFIEQWLNSFGIVSQKFYSPDKQKANLFASLPNSNGQTSGGIILSGHTDVVPIENQIWDSNPFKLLKQADKYYGRGVTDMKGFIAVVLALVPTFLKMHRSLPLHLALSYDEEVGCAGAPVMLQELKQQGLAFDGCVVGEPSNMQLIVAHKGIQLYHVSIQGKAAHSSLTSKGCNAIEYAAQLINFIRDLAEQHSQTGPFDTAYDIPFTSLTTNQITGGNAVNIIPACCEFIYEFRNLPQVNAQALQQQIQHYANKVLMPKIKLESEQATIVIQTRAVVPGMQASEQNTFIQKLRNLTNDSEIRKVAYATEAGLFQTIGIPTVVCGPGSIEQAHQPNEFIEISQLQLCEDFLIKLANV